MFVMNELKIQMYYNDFEERDSDVYIVAFPKSGTTWMQVILYNMVTEDADMSFEHIYDVSPWTSNEAFLNRKPDRVNSLPEPRLIKSHDKYDFFHKDIKGRFIFIYRDGKDVAESYFHHNRNYVDPDLTFDKNFDEHFVQGIGRKKGTWFSYQESWLSNKNNLPILYISYEQLKQNLDGTIDRIAAFLGEELTDKKLENIKKHASFSYMKEHESKFGVKEPKERKLVFNDFIRSGKVGQGEDKLNDLQKTVYNARFNKMVAPYLKKVFKS